MYFQLLHFHFDVSHSKCQANVSSRNRHCIKDYLLIPAIYNHKQIYCNVCFYKGLFRKTSGCNKLHNTVQLLQIIYRNKSKKDQEFFQVFQAPSICLLEAVFCFTIPLHRHLHFRNFCLQRHLKYQSFDSYGEKNNNSFFLRRFNDNAILFCLKQLDKSQ